MDYSDAFNISSIQLEPRLQEYVMRRKFNKDNNIEPSIPEEKEFCITPHDLKIIKRFQQGNKRIYSSSRLSKHPDLIEPDKGSFEERDNALDFKKDPRYERLKKKINSHKNAQQQIKNLEGIDEEYTVFHQSNPYDMKPQNRPQHIAKPYFDPSGMTDLSNDNDHYDNVMMDSRDLMLGPSRPHRKTNNSKNTSDIDQRKSYCYNPNRESKHPETYHHPASIGYKQRLSTNQTSVAGSMKHSRNINEIIGDMDNYNRHLTDTYDYVNDRNAEFDVDTNRAVAGGGSKSRRDNQTTYRPVPFGYGNGLPDISIEESLRGNTIDSSRKSTGFKNSFEHNFSYISKEISDPRHTVNMHPLNSRGQNKEKSNSNKSY